MDFTITESKLQAIKDAISQNKNIAILSHLNPDGDAIGSSLALYHYFRNKGIPVSVILPNHFPGFLKWMPDSEQILTIKSRKKTAISKIEQADIIFCLDFNELSRIENMKEAVEQSKALKVLIDHHPSPQPFADYTFSDTSVSSASELLYEFLCALGGRQTINKTIATCIYSGIMLDTGNFSFNSSNPRTFRIVAELLEKGIDKDEIFYRCYNNYSEDRIRLLGHCLKEKLVILPEHNAGYICISAAELEKFNYQIGDSEGFVNYPLSIKGIIFATLFIEKKEHIKMSFRSKGNFDVNQFARAHFNGGGHKNAAGGKSPVSLTETIEKFKNYLHRYNISS